MAEDQSRQNDPSPNRVPAFYELLLRYRTAANESHEDLGTVLRVTPKAVSMHERPPEHVSARTPPVEVFRLLCAHYREKGILQPEEYAGFLTAWTARRRYRRVRTRAPLPAAASADDAAALFRQLLPLSPTPPLG